MFEGDGEGGGGRGREIDCANSQKGVFSARCGKKIRTHHEVMCGYFRKPLRKERLIARTCTKGVVMTKAEVQIRALTCVHV